MGSQADKWGIAYESVQGFEVPHYVNLKLTDKEKEGILNRVWVTLLVRQTKYSFCQENIP
jgi:hypothetical protein